MSIILSVVATVFASTGFWAFLTTVIQKRHDKRSAQALMLRGLGYDRICTLGLKYIEQGYITESEYDDLYQNLYIPYKGLNGNGRAEKIMKEVEKLPMKSQEG